MTMAKETPAVDDAVLADVNGAAENVGGHVGDQRNGTVDVLSDFCSVNGVVAGDVQIFCVIAHLQILVNVIVRIVSIR